MPTLFGADQNGLEQMNSEAMFIKDDDGKPVVWNFGSRKGGGKQIANEQGIAQTATQKTNFLDCVTQVYGCFTDSKAGGDQLFEVLNFCGIQKEK